MVTIKDVAKKAGVAISTASYALNNRMDKVSSETREKVLNIANQLNYQPNGIARDLKKQKTETIGLFLDSFSGPYYNEIIRGVQEVVRDKDYDLIVCSASGGINSTAYTFLKERRVDGAVILAPKLSNDSIVQVARNTLPIIVLDRELESDYIRNVLINNAKGAYEAVTYLIKLGHSKIGYLSGPIDSYDNIKRFEGYKKALEDNAITYQSKWTVHGDFTEEGGYQAIKNLSNSNLPSAFFSANDEMMIGALTALKELGIKVPDDISLIGFDDIRLSSYIQPKLTTISHPKYEMGKLATELIFKALEEHHLENSLMLSTELVIRESCKEV